MDKKILGRKIRLARQEKGWTQQQLADEYECSQAYVSKLERGGASLDLEALIRLAQVLTKDIYFFIPESESPLEDLKRASRIMASLPDGPIRNEAVASIRAVAERARQRILEQEREERET